MVQIKSSGAVMLQLLGIYAQLGIEYQKTTETLVLSEYELKKLEGAKEVDEETLVSTRIQVHQLREMASSQALAMRPIKEELLALIKNKLTGIGVTKDPNSSSSWIECSKESQVKGGQYRHSDGNLYPFHEDDPLGVGKAIYLHNKEVLKDLTARIEAGQITDEELAAHGYPEDMVASGKTEITQLPYANDFLLAYQFHSWVAKNQYHIIQMWFDKVFPKNRVSQLASISTKGVKSLLGIKEDGSFNKAVQSFYGDITIEAELEAILL